MLIIYEALRGLWNTMTLWILWTRQGKITLWIPWATQGKMTLWIPWATQGKMTLWIPWATQGKMTLWIPGPRRVKLPSECPGPGMVLAYLRNWCSVAEAAKLATCLTAQVKIQQWATYLFHTVRIRGYMGYIYICMRSIEVKCLMNKSN